MDPPILTAECGDDESRRSGDLAVIRDSTLTSFIVADYVTKSGSAYELVMWCGCTVRFDVAKMTSLFRVRPFCLL